MMPQLKSKTGGCLCGAVSFTADLPVKWCAHCHCTMCRRAHGAGYVTWVGFEVQQFNVNSGDDHLTWYESSPGARRGFCDQCGATMLFQSDRWADEIHIALASIDDPTGIEPDTNVYFDHRAEWIVIDESLKNVNPG
jgi:hypothetical protein